MIKVTAYNVNPAKLVDEIKATGQKIISNEWDIFDEEAETVNEMILYFEEGVDIELVQQVIASHNPTPLPPQLTREELLEQRINDLELYILMQEGLI